MSAKFKNNRNIRIRKKNFFQKLFLNQIILSLLGLIIIVLISVPLLKNIKKQYAANSEIKALQQEIKDQKNKNLSLNELIAHIKSDDFIEEQARLDLNYKKDGENVVVIKDKNENSDNGANNTTQNIDEQPRIGKNTPKPLASNQRKWLNYFLK